MASMLSTNLTDKKSKGEEGGMKGVCGVLKNRGGGNEG